MTCVCVVCVKVTRGDDELSVEEVFAQFLEYSRGMVEAYVLIPC